MIFSRIIAVLGLALLGLLAAGGLTLTNVRDDELRIAQWRTVQAAARGLELEAANALQAQTHVTRLLAADPRVLAALAQRTPEMPAAVLPAVFEPVVEQLKAEHRTVDVALFDAQRAPLGSKPSPLAGRLAPRLADLERSPLGLPVNLNGRDRWVMVVPISSLTPATPPGFIATVGPLPVEVVLRAHQDSGQSLVKLAVALMGKPLGTQPPEPWVVPALEAAPKAPVVVPGLPGVRSARFEVPALPGMSLVLGWDEAQPVDVSAVGGLSGVLGRAFGDNERSQAVLSAAAAFIALTLLWGYFGTRRAVKQLARAVEELPTGAPLLPSRYADWLHPISVAAIEAVAAGRKRGRGEGPRPSGEHPVARAVSLTAPTVPVARIGPVDLAGEPSQEPATEPRAATSVPRLDADDGDHESHTDADFRPAVGGSVLPKPDITRSQAPTIPVEPPRHENTAIRPVPVELLAALRDEQGRGEGSQVGPAPADVTPEDEAYMAEVFAEFLELKKQCGEPADPSEYKKFRHKLLRTRQQLVEKFKCKDVRFRVYVRDGKAALRAAPVLEEDAPV